jgi:hypothetical protein
MSASPENWVRALSLIAALLVVGLASPARTEPLNKEATELIEGALFRARLMSNPKAALDYCREAEAGAAKYDRDLYYDGAIAECTAYAHAHLKEKDAACLWRARALEALEKVPDHHPRRAEAVALVGELRRDQSWFGC